MPGSPTTPSTTAVGYRPWPSRARLPRLRQPPPGHQTLLKPPSRTPVLHLVQRLNSVTYHAIPWLTAMLRTTPLTPRVATELHNG